MNTKLTLKNFRVFDNKQGGTFNLAPITILTGCNSSGKSSVVKALLLLRDFFNEICTKKVEDSKLDFSNQVAKLGKYDLAKKRNSATNSKMHFSYLVRSKKIKSSPLLVELEFASRSKDLLNNGWVDRIVVKMVADKKVLLDVNYNSGADVFIKKIDLNLIKGDYMHHIYSDLLYSQATTTLPASTKFQDECIEKYNNWKLAILDKILVAYERCTPKEEFSYVTSNLALGNYREAYESKYPMSLYLSAAEHNVVLPFPIFDTLKNVEKKDVRATIYSMIDSCDRKCSNGEIYEFPYKNALNAVIAEFEDSNYKDFISYYRAKEEEGLVFVDKQYSEEAIYASDSDKHLGFSHKVDSFSSLLAFHGTRYIANENMGKNMLLPSSFESIHLIMIELLKYLKGNDCEGWISEHGSENTYYYEEHNIFSNLCTFFDDVISEVLSPEMYRKFEYVGDSTIEIKRVYPIDNRDNMGALLLKYLEACRNNEWADINPGDFINKWIKAFGIGERVSIESASDGYGIIIRLFHSKDDKKGRLLVDEGFGITKLIVTLINIEYAILTMSKTLGRSYYCLSDDGRYPGECRSYTTISIEEPENHLHPRYQALLAEMFTDAYKNYGVHFIVETHSEYMVRKLQTLVAKKVLTPAEVSLQYLYSPDVEQRPKGEPQVKHIPIREDGILQEPFGSGFLDEADNLAMDILTIKAMR